MVLVFHVSIVPEFELKKEWINKIKKKLSTNKTRNNGIKINLKGYLEKEKKINQDSLPDHTNTK